jgi:integrase/recombinase XerD
MNDPLRVRFSGPLAAHADGFRAELAARGYTPGSAALQLQLAAQLSRWMQARGLEVDGLTAGRVRDFFAQRRARGLKWQVSPQALSWLTGYLAQEGCCPSRSRRRGLRRMRCLPGIAGTWCRSGGSRSRRRCVTCVWPVGS